MYVALPKSATAPFLYTARQVLDSRRTTRGGPPFPGEYATSARPIPWPMAAAAGPDKQAAYQAAEQAAHDRADSRQGRAKYRAHGRSGHNPCDTSHAGPNTSALRRQATAERALRVLDDHGVRDDGRSVLQLRETFIDHPLEVLDVLLAACSLRCLERFAPVELRRIGFVRSWSRGRHLPGQPQRASLWRRPGGGLLSLPPAD